MMRPVRSVQETWEKVEELSALGPLPIDSRIKGFVAGLRRWGVETNMSCEGHLDKLPFPWVMIHRRRKNLVRCTTLLMVHYRESSTNKPLWVIEPIATPRVRTLQEASNETELKELQQQAESFGKLLLDIPEDYFDEQ